MKFPPAEVSRCGVVLDVDGVIHTHGKPIAGSPEAVKQLAEANVPFVFLTNAGGCTEADKAKSLSQLLGGLEVDADQVILAHTPFRHLAKEFQDRRVLVVGNQGCLDAAAAYGFRNVVSSIQLQLLYPELVPFKTFEGQQLRVAEANRQQRSLLPLEEQRAEILMGLKCEAVFYFDSIGVDGLNDVQVVVDVLQASPNASFYMQAEDDLWAASANVGPRLGESLFRSSLERAYKLVVGKPLKVIQYGKPRRVAFVEAEEALQRRVAILRRRGRRQTPEEDDGEAKTGTAAAAPPPPPLDVIYMVGDNLNVDILGANAMGEGWRSVHVQTGVQKSATGPSRFLSASNAAVADAAGDAEHVRLHRSIHDASETGEIKPHLECACLADFVDALLSPCPTE